MKVAIASEGQSVSMHFGHCQGFTIFDVVDNKINGKSFIPNPGHRPGFLPVFLKENNIDLIIAGGMGGSAQDLFRQNGIEVIVGAQGMCDDIIEAYLKNELKSTGSVCHEHSQGDCH